MKCSSPISAPLHHSSRRAHPLAALLLAAASFAIFNTSVFADPLNPLDFTTLGTQTLPAGSYTINTAGATPTLTGPINLNGTVSA